MKTIIKFLPLAVIMVLMASCGSVDVMKRRYTSGFYVHHQSGKHTPESNVNKPDNKNKTVAPEEKEAIPVIAANDGDKSVSTENAGKTPVAGDDTDKSSSKKKGCSKEKKADKESEDVGVKDKSYMNELTPEDRAQLDYKASGAESAGRIILLVILSILLPPLAVYLKNDRTDKWFWVTFVLCLLTLLGSVIAYLFSFWFIAFVIALLVVLDVLK